MESNNSNTTLVQIPLFDITRVKKTGVSAKNIETIKSQILKKGFKLLSVTIQPTRKEGDG